MLPTCPLFQQAGLFWPARPAGQDRLFPPSSNQDALDFIEADLIVAVVIELGGAGRGVVSDHRPLHSRGFSRLQSLSPPLPQGRVVARLRNAQSAQGLRACGAAVIMGEHHLSDEARGELRGPAKPDVPLTRDLPPSG